MEAFHPSSFNDITYDVPGDNAIENQENKEENEKSEPAAENGQPELPEIEGDGEKKKKKRNRKKGGKVTQTYPPSVPIADLYPDGVFPIGEIQEYVSSKDDRTAINRMTSEEKRAMDRMQNDIYNEVRLAAEAHRQVSTIALILLVILVASSAFFRYLANYL